MKICGGGLESVAGELSAALLWFVITAAVLLGPLLIMQSPTWIRLMIVLFGAISTLMTVVLARRSSGDPARDAAGGNAASGGAMHYWVIRLAAPFAAVFLLSLVASSASIILP
jgi:hypothetical protein